MTNKEYKTGDKPPSDMFLDSMQEGGVGSDELTCDFCGRLHLCPDSCDSGRDEDEMEAFRQYCFDEKKRNPDGVILHEDYDCVIGRHLNGMTFVLNCPCNGLYRYEVFIWEHRNTIRNYLKVRIEQEHQWAEEELTLNKLSGISK
jgi:hypothetical protein